MQWIRPAMSTIKMRNGACCRNWCRNCARASRTRASWQSPKRFMRTSFRSTGTTHDPEITQGRLSRRRYGYPLPARDQSQPEAQGQGHKVLCALSVKSNEPFAVIQTDNKNANDGHCCLRQMHDVFN